MYFKYFIPIFLLTETSAIAKLHKVFLTWVWVSYSSIPFLFTIPGNSRGISTSFVLLGFVNLICWVSAVCTWLAGEWTTWGAGAAVRYSGGCAVSCRPELSARQSSLTPPTPPSVACSRTLANVSSTTDGAPRSLDASSRTSYARTI